MGKSELLCSQVDASKMRKIYTVIIVDEYYEVSTCSFVKFESAVQYILSELHNMNAEISDWNVEDLLNYQMHYEYDNFRFSIEEANLVDDY